MHLPNRGLLGHTFGMHEFLGSKASTLLDSLQTLIHGLKDFFDQLFTSAVNVAA